MCLVMRNVVLIRLTKCGGTSFEKAIGKQKLPIFKFTPTEGNVNRYQKKKNVRELKHFSIIRNPYDKAISSYKWLTIGKGYNRLGEFQKIIKKNISLFDFYSYYVEYKQRYEEYESILHKSGVVYPKNDARIDYFWFIQHMEGMYESIDTFIRPNDVDHFVKIENYASDLKVVEGWINQKITLNHYNKTRKNRDYRGEYDDKSFDLICDIYKKDVSFFDYEF